MNGKDPFGWPLFILGSFMADTNDTKKQRFLKAFKALDCNISKACEAINIERKTFYRWKDKSKKFAQQVQEIEESDLDEIEVAHKKKAKEGDRRAMEFQLLSRRKDKYANRQEHEYIFPDIVEIKHYVQVEKPEVIEEKDGNTDFNKRE